MKFDILPPMFAEGDMVVSSEPVVPVCQNKHEQWLAAFLQPVVKKDKRLKVNRYQYSSPPAKKHAVLGCVNNVIRADDFLNKYEVYAAYMQETKQVVLANFNSYDKEWTRKHLYLVAVSAVFERQQIVNSSSFGTWNYNEGNRPMRLLQIAHYGIFPEADLMEIDESYLDNIYNVLP